MTRLCFLSCGLLVGAIAFAAEEPHAPASQTVARYTATTANVSGAPDNIRIDILRWSTDAEREKLMDAWDLKVAPTGRGAAAAGRGAAARGGAARGGAGRGGGRGGASESTPRPTPEGELAIALKATTTVGYLWSSEVAGYAIRYAGRIANADGSERIVLITQRRLGAVNDLWKPAGAETLPYDFSLIELHLKSNGEGEGKASLIGKIAPDTAFKFIALQNYDSLPIVLTNVKRARSHDAAK